MRSRVYLVVAGEALAVGPATLIEPLAQALRAAQPWRAARVRTVAIAVESAQPGQPIGTAA